MLSLITMADAAVPARARSRMGASLLELSGPAAPRYRAVDQAVATMAAARTAVASLRPQAGSGAVPFGNGTHAAGQAKFASQQPTSQKFAHTMTRIAAAGGGALGPHPARDPV